MFDKRVFNIGLWTKILSMSSLWILTPCMIILKIDIFVSLELSSSVLYKRTKMFSQSTSIKQVYIEVLRQSNIGRQSQNSDTAVLIIND